MDNSWMVSQKTKHKLPQCGLIRLKGDIISQNNGCYDSQDNDRLPCPKYRFVLNRLVFLEDHCESAKIEKS